MLNPGIHLVHKPVGPTSFAFVKPHIESASAEPSRRRLRICHGGALDPFANGLLLLLAGGATQLFDHLHAVPKVYEATVRWGVETDNGDPLGRTTFTGDGSKLSAAQLDDLLATFIGWRDQVPPATSNKRIDGERAYLKAHRGESVVMPASRVYLHDARWLGHDLPRESRMRVTVRGGYYIRALARDAGRLLGCGAHLTELHRTVIGPWQDPGPDRSVELHGRDILPWASSRILTDQEVGELRENRPIPMGILHGPEWNVPSGFPDPAAPVRGFHLDRLAFLLRPQEEKLSVASALRGGL